MRSAALLVLGLVLLIGGVALAALNIWAVVLSLVGFGVMMLGGIMALRTPATAVTQPAFGTQSPRPRSQRTTTMEENFRRRFEDRQ